MERIEYSKRQYAAAIVISVISAAALCYLTFGKRYGEMFTPFAGGVGVSIGTSIGLLLQLSIGAPKPAEGGGWKRFSDAIITIGGTGMVAGNIYLLYKEPLQPLTWVWTGLLLWCIVLFAMPRLRYATNPMLYGGIAAVTLVSAAAYLLVLHPLTAAQAEAVAIEQGYTGTMYTDFDHHQAPAGCYVIYGKRDSRWHYLYIDVLDGELILARPER